MDVSECVRLKSFLPDTWLVNARVLDVLAIPGHEPEAIHAQMPGDRERIRQFSTIGLLNLLRMRLLALP